MEAAKRGELFIMYSQKENSYTTADIETLPEGQRAELIDGKMYMMASPALSHQEILAWMNNEILNYIRGRNGKCRIIPAPFGVFIKKDDRNYFEPDISVVCRRDRLNQKGCHGAPDWVIEIVSSSSRRMDYCLKPPIYREAGVREYWIVDYERRKVTVYPFQESDNPKEYCFNDTIKAGIYEDLEIDFARLSKYLES